jgi:hypothetical protein
MGLQIKEQKTKYTVAGRRQSKGQNRENLFRIGSYRFEQVDSFIYIGSLVNTNNDISQEKNASQLQIDVTMESRNSLNHICWCRNKIKLRTQNINKTSVDTCFRDLCMKQTAWIYTGHIWKEDTETTYGAAKQGSEWRVRHNQELNDLYKDVGIITHIMVGRMKWEGHKFE